MELRERRCNRPDYTPARLYPGKLWPRPVYTPGTLWPRPIHTPQAIIYPGVTGHNIPPAGFLGQFIPPQAKLYTHDINHDINSVERYTQELFNFSTSY